MMIDFTKESKLLTEDYLALVGEWSKWLMNRMWGDEVPIVGTMSPKDAMAMMTEEGCGEDEQEQQKTDFIIRGKYRDVKAYAQALGREKDYISAYAEYGEDHMITARAKAKLDQATNHFERLTGIMWPFK
jgi:hypothetical protein